MSKARNPVISVSRVIGMFSIILCHIIRYYTFIPGSAFLGQVFGAGVQLFIFVSGYLYGGKTVTAFGKWYTQRFLAVSFPTILLTVPILIILLLLNIPVSVGTFAVYSMNLEGFLFLNNHVSVLFEETSPLGHLWFTTVIMLCYLLVPLLQKIKAPFFTASHSNFMIAFVLVGTGLCFVLTPVLNIQYFFVFIFGYLFGKAHLLENIRFPFCAWYTVATILAVVIRLLLRRFFDGTDIYTFCAETSRIIIGTWPVIFLAFLYHKFPRTINVVADWRAMTWLDKYSFYIYLTHGLFCADPFNLFLSLSLPIATLLFFTCTVCSAIVLNWVSDLITRPFITRLKA